jgi:hypothetical protein
MEGVIMQTQSRAGRVGVVLFVLLIAASVGFMAYRVGFGHGVAQGLAMNLAAAGPEAAKVAPNAALAPYGPYPYPYPYGWHGHGGWGWGFFPFGVLGPFLLIGFWFFALRILFWGGGPGRRRGWYDGHRRDAETPSGQSRL